MDITLVEGAVSSDDDLRRIREVRRRTRILVSLGDCAVTTQCARDAQPIRAAPDRSTGPTWRTPRPPAAPVEAVPGLLAESLPVHAWVPVEVFMPGCPPSADRIFETIDGPARGQSAGRRQSPSRFG